MQAERRRQRERLQNKDSWLHKAVNVPRIPRHDYPWSRFYPFPVLVKMLLVLCCIFLGFKRGYFMERGRWNFALRMVNAIGKCCVVTCAVYTRHPVIKNFLALFKDTLNLGMKFVHNQPYIAETLLEESLFAVSGLILFAAAVLLIVIPAIFEDIHLTHFHRLEEFTHDLFDYNLYMVLSCMTFCLGLCIVYYPFYRRQSEREVPVPGLEVYQYYSVKRILQDDVLTKMFYILWQFTDQPLIYVGMFIFSNVVGYTAMAAAVFTHINFQPTMPHLSYFSMAVCFICILVACFTYWRMWKIKTFLWIKQIRQYRRLIMKDLVTMRNAFRKRGTTRPENRKFKRDLIKVSQLRTEAAQIIKCKELHATEIQELEDLIYDVNILRFTADCINTHPRITNCCIS